MGGALQCALWIASTLWMGLCLFLSWQSGESTVRVSGTLAEELGRLLRMPENKADKFHTRLRQAAHVVLFFIEAVLFACAFSASLAPGCAGPAAVYAAASCCASATLAETLKVFIPGRHLQWSEVLLNLLGVLGGVAVVWAGVSRA